MYVNHQLSFPRSACPAQAGAGRDVIPAQSLPREGGDEKRCHSRVEPAPRRRGREEMSFPRRACPAKAGTRRDVIPA